MKRMSSHPIGVDQGLLELFSDFQDGGDMWTGSNVRADIRTENVTETGFDLVFRT
jgi:hypothetical protein